MQMSIEFDGEMIYWRGPAPWYFVRVPEEESDHLNFISSEVTYGWGMIPVKARIGKTEWETSLFPKDGAYLIPIKAKIRKAESLAKGDMVSIQLDIEKK